MSTYSFWAVKAFVLIIGIPFAMAQGPDAATPSITLAQALSRARSNEPNYVAALAASNIAIIDQSLARAALLPSIKAHNQILYTQPRSQRNQADRPETQRPYVFVANNAVHEYASQGTVTEALGLAQITAVPRAASTAAVARAEAEISRRGLTFAVTNLFYGIHVAEGQLQIEEMALNEATSFVKLTTEREVAREAAHSDVVKAQLSMQQRERDVADAKLALQKAQLDLGVLLFPDPRTPYTLTQPEAKQLPTREEVELAAVDKNPELQRAIAKVRGSALDVRLARSAYLPDLTLNYTYGIDSDHFSINEQPGIRNLGYSVGGTLDIPIWDGLATLHRVQKAELVQASDGVLLTSTQRTLLAQIEESYTEAAEAGRQISSLTETVDTARESLRLVELRYTAGEAAVLEVVDAQNAMTTAQLGLNVGNGRYLSALANLQLLSGTL